VRRHAPSVGRVEDLAQSVREGLGLTRVSELPAHKPTVVAGEHGGLLPEQLGRGHRSSTREGAQGLLAHGEPPWGPLRVLSDRAYDQNSSDA
jgi:hypothetical protein